MCRLLSRRVGDGRWRCGRLSNRFYDSLGDGDGDGETSCSNGREHGRTIRPTWMRLEPCQTYSTALPSDVFCSVWQPYPCTWPCGFNAIMLYRAAWQHLTFLLPDQ